MKGIQYKTTDQMRLMRAAGLVVARALEVTREALRPGVSTADLNALAEQTIRGGGATPSFLGYQGYPASLCISVNDEVVHGIPGARVLAAGDLISIDCGAIVAGWHGDAAFSALVPGSSDPADPADPSDPAGSELVSVTEGAMWHGIAAIKTGQRLNTIGAAVEDFVAGRYGLVEEYGGHGIGTAMHQDPHVLNYRTRDKGPRLKPGICLAIEPMLTAGAPATKVLADDWTVVTKDGLRAAHWEHSVALHDGGLWVLTAPDGGEAALGALGVRFAPLAD